MAAPKSLNMRQKRINSPKLETTSHARALHSAYIADSADIMDIPEGHRMSDEIMGLALQFGRHPELKPVTQVQQAAEMSSVAPTLIVIEPKRRLGAVVVRRKRGPGVLLKEACTELLEQQEGGFAASKRGIRMLRLDTSTEIASVLSRFVVRETGRPRKPEVMFIERRGGATVSSEPQVSFAEKLREALCFLDQVAGTDCQPQHPPSGCDNDDQLQLARERRDQLLAEPIWFNAPEVHAQQGGKPGARGVNNTASRARRAGELLGAWDGREYQHPRFQFDLKTGRLMPEMKQLLELLPQDRSGWRQIFWLFQKHGQLDGQRPADLFQKDPAAVIKAARSDFVLDDERW